MYPYICIYHHPGGPQQIVGTMATIRTELKRPNSEVKTALRFVITDGRKYRIRIPADISVKPKHFNNNETVTAADPQAVAKNRHIRAKREQVFDIFLEAKRSGILPDIQYFSEKLEAKPIVRVEFWELWNMFLESKKGVYQKESFVKYNSLKKHLIAFEKHIRKKPGWKPTPWSSRPAGSRS